MKKRVNKMNVEWAFANRCWTALREGQPLPPVPTYQEYEVAENTGHMKLVKEHPIEPMKITYEGKVYFG